MIDDLPAQTAFAGDNTVITLVGIEMNNIGIGESIAQRFENESMAKSRTQIVITDDCVSILLVDLWFKNKAIHNLFVSYQCF